MLFFLLPLQRCGAISSTKLTLIQRSEKITKLFFCFVVNEQITRKLSCKCTQNFPSDKKVSSPESHGIVHTQSSPTHLETEGYGEEKGYLDATKSYTLDL